MSNLVNILLFHFSLFNFKKLITVLHLDILVKFSGSFSQNELAANKYL